MVSYAKRPLPSQRTGGCGCGGARAPIPLPDLEEFKEKPIVVPVVQPNFHPQEKKRELKVLANLPQKYVLPEPNHELMKRSKIIERDEKIEIKPVIAPIEKPVAQNIDLRNIVEKYNRNAPISRENSHNKMNLPRKGCSCK